MLKGQETEHFEDSFARYVGTRHAVTNGSGLDALRLIFEAWITLGRLRAGDEVIVPANSFIASALAVSQAGLVPKLADVSSATHNLAPESIVDALTERTRAVMAVHLYGSTEGIDAVRDLCSDRQLLLVEDSAQAHGARRPLGSAGAIGDAAAFSFYPAKNLGALGDGGCSVTDDDDLADRIRVLANYGSRTKYIHEQRGINSRLDEANAAFLSIKLKCLDDDNARRRLIAARYRAEIRNEHVEVPEAPSAADGHVWHLFVVHSDRRAELQAHLERLQIETMIHYPVPIHLQPAYAGVSTPPNGLPVAEELADSVISIPMSPVLSDGDVSRIIHAMNTFGR